MYMVCLALARTCLFCPGLGRMAGGLLDMGEDLEEEGEVGDEVEVEETAESDKPKCIFCTFNLFC